MFEILSDCNTDNRSVTKNLNNKHFQVKGLKQDFVRQKGLLVLVSNLL